MNLPSNFANELALRLRGKNQPKDNESEHSKTPESPTGIETGTSSSRNLFNDTRTPRSMSSLSHSSNSLLSGNTANIYGASDGESVMSRSVIDSHDDIGIVVDLATPICKTTTAALLDSTAARQKIAASRPRRARPKAIVNTATDKTDTVDSGQFSPVRDKRDILEEISEEDCPVSSTCHILSEDHDSMSQLEIKPELDSEDIITIPGHSPLPKEEDLILNVTENTVNQPNESGDFSVLKNQEISAPLPSSNHDEAKSQFNLHKSKFHAEVDKSAPESSESIFSVKLRSTGLNNLVHKSKDPIEDKAKGSEHSEKPSINKEAGQSSDLPRVSRYSPLKTSKDPKAHVLNLPNSAEHTKTVEANKNSAVAHNATSAGHVDKRASRVLNMVKNFENSPCTESH